MKKLNLIYNHNIFDEPYKKAEIKKALSEIENKFGKDLEIFITHTSFSTPNQFFYDSDFIVVEHTFDINSEDKKYLANILNKSVTKLKKYEQIDVVITFRQISEDDIYFFKNK